MSWITVWLIWKGGRNVHSLYPILWLPSDTIWEACKGPHSTNIILCSLHEYSLLRECYVLMSLNTNLCQHWLEASCWSSCAVSVMPVALGRSADSSSWVRSLSAQLPSGFCETSPWAWGYRMSESTHPDFRISLLEFSRLWDCLAKEPALSFKCASSSRPYFLFWIRNLRTRDPKADLGKGFFNH